MQWNTGETSNAIVVNDPGTYYVVSSNACGTDTVFIEVLSSSVTSQFTTNVTNGFAPLTVNFQNNSIGADTYVWNMDDGMTFNLFEVQYIYTNSGTFVVSLIASNQYGCSDTSYNVIVIDSCNYTMYIPNTFTPNDDGLNDIFEVKGECINRGNLYIFNRWGEEIFSFIDTSSLVWNGKTKLGNDAVSGVYNYLIEVVDDTGAEHTYIGFVHLFK